MKLLSYSETWALTKGNKGRIYGKRQGIDNGGFARSVELDFPDLFIFPKFRIDRTEKIFTIG